MFTSLTLTSYQHGHQNAVFRLLRSQTRSQVHLNWRPVHQWLNDPGVSMVLAWDQAQLVGALAASPPQSGTCWLQLIALHDNRQADDLLPMLWDAMRQELLKKGITRIAVLAMRAWLETALAVLGFHPLVSIVSMCYSGGVIPATRPTGWVIRPIKVQDVPAVLTVDQMAFEPLWQMLDPELRQAVCDSAYATLAEFNGQVIGYQLCTLAQNNIHLARLATAPQFQGQGVAGALLRDALRYFQKRGVTLMTVNTQEDNQTSLHLYHRCGFEYSGLNILVWDQCLTPEC
jgi:ribosomal-protein-alanine N-acetyltransferase